MAAAILSISIQPYRLLTKSQAAGYCSRSARSFEEQVPVAPIVMANGDRLWDVRDLDRWIDGLKGAALVPSQEDYLSRLD